MKGMSADLAILLKTSLSYFHCWYQPSRPEDSLNPYVILLTHYDHEGSAVLVGSILPWLPIRTAGQVANNVVRAIGMYEVMALVILAPPDVPMGDGLCNSPHLDGVSGYGNGRGDVPKRMKG